MHALRMVMVSTILVLATGALAGDNHRPDASPIISGTNIDLVDVIESGLVYSVTASDPYVYAAFGRVLAVLDVSTPGSATRVGAAVLPSTAFDMELNGDYLYCYCSQSVVIVDVLFPSAPKLAGSFAVLGDRLDVDGGRLYVEHNSTLRIYDLADPIAPSLLGTSVASLGQEFEAQNGYVVSSYNGPGGSVKVFDATNPANPVLVGSLPITNGTDDVDLAWPYAYAVNASPLAGRGLHIVNITNPALPTEVGYYASGPAFEDLFDDVAVNGNRAYVAGGAFPLTIFDVSNPALPIRLAPVGICQDAFDRTIMVSGRLGVIRSDRMVCVLDCSNPSSPIPLASYEALPSLGGLALSPTHLVMSAPDGSLALVNRNDTQERWFYWGDLEDVNSYAAGVKDGYAYTLNSSLVIGTTSFTAFDISNPIFPSPVGGVGVGGFPSDFALGSNRAYTWSFSQLVAINISDPTNPSIAGQASTPILPKFAAAEPYVYGVTANNGLVVFNVSNPTPVQVGAGLSEAAIGGEPLSVAAAGSHAYIVAGGGSGGLRVVDVSNPLAPAIVGDVPVACPTGGPNAVTVFEAFAYFYTPDGVLRVANVSNPSLPVEIASIPVADLSSLSVSPPFVYALGFGGHVVQFETDLATGIDTRPHASVVLRQNYPNPFNPSTTISFELSSRAAVRVEIFDARGAWVRTLADETMDAGPHALEWNGRDETGSIVGSGVYFYRLTAGGHSLAKKMVILK